MSAPRRDARLGVGERRDAADLIASRLTRAHSILSSSLTFAITCGAWMGLVM